MKVYLGGPMRGFDRFNFPAFDAAALRLRSHGYEVLSPAEHDRECGFDETRGTLDGFDLEAAFAWDLQSIEQAHCVAFLAGWERSEGCAKEYDHARRLGRPVYQYTPGGPGEFALDLVALNFRSEASC